MNRPRAGWVVPLLVAGLLVCSAVAPALGSADRTGPEPNADLADGSFSEVQQEFDRTEFRVIVHGDGSATWLFRYEQTLANDEERDDFETFADEFNTEETELYRNFVDRATGITESGSDATGREMAATDFDRQAFVTDFGNQGVVEMAFTWEAFAVVDDERVVVSDVFEGGFYISTNQRLVFETSDELVFDDVDPEPDSISGESLAESSSITYDGEQSFTDDRPRVVYVDADSAPATTPTATPGDQETDEPTDGTMGWMLPAGAFLLVVLLGLSAAVAYRSGVLTTTRRGDVAETAAAADATSVDPEPSDTEPSEPAVSDEELMADDERVVKLLKSNGGRMKQVNIVNETGWSKSKVSMLLSEMEDDGEITKLRVGRENIISLPGHEPDAARSPFDDE